MKAALLAGLLALVAGRASAAASTAPAVSASTHWKAALSNAASPAASRLLLLPPVLMGAAIPEGPDAYMLGKGLDNLHKSVVSCGEYLEKLAAQPPSDENSRQRATYSLYMQNSRDAMARHLALLQDALQSRPTLKDYKDRSLPLRIVKAKGDVFTRRLPREEDFGLPVKDPFDALSSDGLKTGGLEFAP